jgi:cytochrome oxidase Cu insertion factor (SCO1/SenC/PrrC family)
MTRSLRLLSLAVLIAGLGPATSTAAADLDGLMQEFRVIPAGLKPAPAFTLKRLDGKVTALADQRGRPVLLYFWATW